MSKRYEGIEIIKVKGMGLKSVGNNYKVSWYEWVDGQGRDCGLNKEDTHLTREEAFEMKAWMESQNG